MNRLSTKQLIRLVAYLFVYTIFIAFSNFLMIKGIDSKKAEEQFSSIAEQKAHIVNDFFDSIEQTVSLLYSGVVSSVKDVNQLKDSKFVHSLENNQKNLLKTALEYQKHAYSVYVRYNPDYASPTAGLFLTKDESGSINTIPPTDISLYDPSDVEHVGWWYFPTTLGYSTWTEPYYNSNIDVYMISYIIPIYIKGELLGVIGMDVDYHTANTLITGIKIYQTGFTYLKGKNGLVVYHPFVDFGANYECPKGYKEITVHLNNDMLFSVVAPKREVFRETTRVIYLLFTIDFLIFVLMGMLLFFTCFKRNYTELIMGENKEGRASNTATFGLVFIVTVFSIIFIQFAFICAKTGIFKSPNYAKSKTEYEENLLVLVEADVEPYSFVNTRGLKDGFNVAFADKLSNTIHKNLILNFVPGNNFDKSLKAQKFDMILGVKKEFIQNNPNYCISETLVKDYYKIYSKQRIKGLGELKGKKVGSVLTDIESDINLYSANKLYFDSYKELFSALYRDEIDFAVGIKSVCDNVIQKNHYKEISSVYELLTTHICVAVPKQNKILLETVNYAIDSLKEDGVLDSLRELTLEGKRDDVNVLKIVRENSIFFIITSTIVIVLFLIVLWISMRTYYEEKHRVREKTLIQLSETDQLTGILNRGAGEEKIQQLMKLSKEGMFLLMDADKFKSINDTYGHAVGDKVICAIADSLKKSFRDRDVILRLGGDEFAAYAVGVTTEAIATVIINRFFSILSNVYIPEMGDKKINVSAGASFYDGNQTISFDDLYKKADALTYKSKSIEGCSISFQ